MRVTNDTRSQVQDYLSKDDIKWLYASMVSVAVALLSVLLAIIFLMMTGASELFWAAVVAFGTGVIAFFVSVWYGTNKLTARGIDLVEVGRVAIYGDKDAGDDRADVDTTASEPSTQAEAHSGTQDSTPESDKMSDKKSE